jgi:O-antigen/teichoic acid export membrane protein
MITRLHTLLAYLNSKGFFDLMIARFLMQFMGLGTVLLVARLVPITDLGDIKIIQSYSELFMLFAGFGFSTAVLKICSERSSLKDKESLLRSAALRSLCTSLLSMVLLTILATTRVITPTAHVARWLMIYSLAIPFAVMSELLVTFLQAQKKIKVMARIQSIVKIQSVVIIIICTWRWGFKGFIVATVIAFVAGLIPLFLQVGTRFLTLRSRCHTQRFMHYATYSMLGNFVSQLGQRGDILILDHLVKNRANIGYYALASIFTLAAVQATGVVQQILIPYFSEHSNDIAWIKKQLKINIQRMTLLGIVIALFIYFAAWFIISAFFDPSYYIVLQYLSVLLVGYFIFSTYAVVGAALLGLGFMRYNFLCVVISTPLSLLFMCIGFNHFGIIGLAWSSVVASSVKAMLTFCLLPVVLKKSVNAPRYGTD